MLAAVAAGPAEHEEVVRGVCSVADAACANKRRSRSHRFGVGVGVFSQPRITVIVGVALKISTSLGITFAVTPVGVRSSSLPPHDAAASQHRITSDFCGAA